MPTAGDQVPGGATDLARRVQALEREVRELRAAKRLQNASVGAGGLRIVDGGRLSMDTPDGRRMVDIGAVENPDYDHGDGSPQQAMWFRREDGSTFFACFSYPAGGGGEEQAWTFYDRSGNNILAEDTSSGVGLARPYLPLNAPVALDSTTWPRGFAATFSTISVAWNTLWQPKMRLYALTSTVGTATGEVQVLVEGNPWGPVVTAGAAFDHTDVIPDVQLGRQFQIEVQARRLTGTGSIAAQVFMIYGRQT
ncbi:hypothetical protein ACN24M_24710 [Streptomyces microflavus]